MIFNHFHCKTLFTPSLLISLSTSNYSGLDLANNMLSNGSEEAAEWASVLELMGEIQEKDESISNISANSTCDPHDQTPRCLCKRETWTARHSHLASFPPKESQAGAELLHCGAPSKANRVYSAPKQITQRLCVSLDVIKWEHGNAHLLNPCLLGLIHLNSLGQTNNK